MGKSGVGKDEKGGNKKLLIFYTYFNSELIPRSPPV